MLNIEPRSAAPVAASPLYASAKTTDGEDTKPFYDSAKRCIDVAGAGLILLTALPILLLVVLALLIAQGRPIIVSHQRVGRNGKRFSCLKFRSMVTEAQAVLERHLADNPEASIEWAANRKLKADPRVTPLGRILRKSSVDELPQLVNVLLGEMSLVGPRPIVEAEIVNYGAHIHHYYRVHPGITGHWQVSGRSDVSYTARIKMDVEYVERRSVGRDLLILIRTVPVILASKGSY